MAADLEKLLATGDGLRIGSKWLSDHDLIGRVLGNYRLLSVVGEGGMSQVYRAERVEGSFEREVAIKICAGSFTSQEPARRFSQEQMLLAAMDHPNISRLYDAQISPDGRAYIVMELIDGKTIDRYCDSRGNVTEVAVELVAKICAAVAYAHAHLIVHRDIKPGNVMVDQFEQPKLLDFGIAKLLEDETAEEGTAAAPMTPQYASPEQLLHRPVTIASDIYQLGALLYRLATGRPLVEEGSVERAVVCAGQGEELPLTPPDRQRLPRDLRLIIERCLRAEPEARYPSADALRKDLVAYRDGFPVEVAGGGFRYRAGRFLRRNRAIVGVAATALVLLAGVTVAYTQSLAQSRQLAEARAQSATRTSKALSRLLTESMSDLQDQVAEHGVGGSIIVKSVFEDAVRLASQELDTNDVAKADLIRVRANAEWRLGKRAEASVSFRQAGELSSANGDPTLFTEIQLDSIRLALEERQVTPAAEALAELEALVDVTSLDPLTQARFHRTRGYFFHAQDEFGAADAAYLDALEQLNTLGAEHDRDRADLLTDLAWVHIGREQFEKARDYARAAAELLEAAESPMSYRLINPLRTLALALGLIDDYGAAQEVNERVLQIAKANYGENHRAVGRVQSSLSSLYFRQGNIHRAISHEQEALRIEQALYGGDSWDAMVTRNTLVLYLGSAGRIPEALADSEALLSEISAREGREGRRNLEALLANRSQFLMLAGNFKDAVAAGRRSLELRRSLQGAGSYADFDSQRELSLLLLAAGQVDEARALFDSSLAGFATLRGEDDKEYGTWSLSEYLFDRAAGNLVAARGKLERYIQISGASQAVDSAHALAPLVDLAEICTQLQDFACAREMLEQLAGTLSSYPTHPDVLAAQLLRAELLSHAQQSAEAHRLATDVLAIVHRDYPGRTDLQRRALRLQR